MICRQIQTDFQSHGKSGKPMIPLFCNTYIFKNILFCFLSLKQKTLTRWSVRLYLFSTRKQPIYFDWVLYNQMSTYNQICGHEAITDIALARLKVRRCFSSHLYFSCESVNLNSFRLIRSMF